VPSQRHPWHANSLLTAQPQQIAVKLERSMVAFVSMLHAQRKGMAAFDVPAAEDLYQAFFHQMRLVNI
jgi:hypothetical protein